MAKQRALGSFGTASAPIIMFDLTESDQEVAEAAVNAEVQDAPPSPTKHNHL